VFRAGLDALDQVQALAGFQRQVHDGQIGVLAFDQLHRVGDVLRFAADQQVGLARDACGQALAHDGVIVHDQDLDLGDGCVPAVFIHGCFLERACR
jgi:hypothetical protein